MTVKIVFLLACVALLATALPSGSRLLSSSSSRSDNGYDFSYSTFDETREEHGVLVPRLGPDGPDTVLEVHGFYSFVGDDERTYRVDYVAGEFGYKANVTVEEHPEEVPIINPNALKSLVG